MKIKNPPVASALMTTARSFGNYDLASALADLIDNSIDAKASRISINFFPSKTGLTVRIRDDGEGMTDEALISAMRPASSNPEHERRKSDLGRFGWGLKSASLSQARILTVATWRNKTVCCASWDLDNLGDDWEMTFSEGKEAEDQLAEAIATKSGTEVIWRNCDRILEVHDLEYSTDLLNSKISHAQKQLSLVFHRYLKGKPEEKIVSISIQGNELRPTDPFMSNHPATQCFDEEPYSVSGSESIYVRPYVIPHYSKLTVEEKDKLGGDEGLIKNQGFYIYRNRRLIIYGTWFRIVPHGELSQLLRIRIDLPNNAQDIEWKITLDKSDAQLPSRLRPALKTIIEKFKKQSVLVNRKKGVPTDLRRSELVWKRVIHHGKVKYEINRQHPLIASISNSYQKSTDQSGLSELLSLIESYLPLDSLINDQSDSKIQLSQSLTDPEEFGQLIENALIHYARTIKFSDLNSKKFKEFLKTMEPFVSHWAFVESYIDSRMSLGRK